jgi:hypothetical protein
MTERRHLIAAVLVVLGLGLRLMTLSACGGVSDDEFPVEVAFTPTATIIVMRDCGNGEFNPNIEVCDASAPGGEAPCTAQGKSCICCACLNAGETLGQRAFSIARPGSQFRSTGLQCNDVSTDGGSGSCLGDWLPGPLMLQAGVPDPTTCVAPLTLTQDVIFGFCQPLGIACFKLYAAESEGSIDCDGGTPYDLLFEQNSNKGQPDDPPVITRGLGDPTQTGESGNADLLLASRVAVQIQGIFDPMVCLDLNYEDPASDPRININDVSSGPLAFTTRKGEAIVLDSLVPDADRCSFTGARFTCGRFSEENSSGVLVGPVTALGQLGGVIDTANVSVIADSTQ